jgi:hypothetical protein
MRQKVFILAIVAVSIVPACRLRGRASGDAGPGPAGSTTTTSAPPTAAEGQERLKTLESHLSYGSTWGSDAEAEKMARGVSDVVVNEFAYAKRNELGVAVEIVPGKPRKVVALVKMKYLKDEGTSDRKKILTMVRDGLAESERFGSDSFVIGVKGAVFWGAIGTGRGFGSIAARTGSSLSSEPLAKAFASAPSGEGTAGAPAGVAGHASATGASGALDGADTASRPTLATLDGKSLGSRAKAAGYRVTHATTMPDAKSGKTTDLVTLERGDELVGCTLFAFGKPSSSAFAYDVSSSRLVEVTAEGTRNATEVLSAITKSEASRPKLTRSGLSALLVGMKLTVESSDEDGDLGEITIDTSAADGSSVAVVVRAPAIGAAAAADAKHFFVVDADDARASRRALDKLVPLGPAK